jgi:thiosulfate/3-mercaptopyruvate sulfurtransferase
MKYLKNALPIVLSIWIAAFCITGCGSSTSVKGPADAFDYPNGGLLISGTVLKSKLNQSTTVIIDTRSADAYAASHIPGAINLQWTQLADFPGAVLKSVPELETLLGAAGLVRTRHMVIYDDTTASWGSAGRIFWMLEYLGCSNLQILYGGWDKWLADSHPTETAPRTLSRSIFSAVANPVILANKDHIASRLGNTDFAVIDSRTDEEYVGWQLYGEARPGHIPGAVQIPYAWFFNTDKTLPDTASLGTLFTSRGITPDKEVTSYCTAGIRSGFVYFALRLMGYTRCSNYAASMNEWAADATQPMEVLPNYEKLVYPGWIKALIDYHAPGSSQPAPANYPYGRDHKYLIFETQWGSFEEMEKGWADASYLNGHIPGAFHSNSDTYENGYPRWFLLPEDELNAAVGSMGITADTTVVVYSNNPIFAARLWWILSYAGVADVRVLNGGYAEWVAAGYEEEKIIHEPVATTYDGTIRPEFIASTDYVEANYDEADTLQADVRTYPEFTGEVSGYSYVVNKGRIPGAIFAFNADNPDRFYLDADGTVRSFTEVRAMWQSLGIQLTAGNDEFEKEVIFYCGSGYRSSLGFFYAHLMGYENVRNYSDGWEGWSTTYIEDPTFTADPDIPGSTDGWRQEPSGRPVASGEESND